MGCYFSVDVYFSKDKERKEYDEYIALVKPIVEAYGGQYLVRSEDVIALSKTRTPDRVIIIRFPDKKALDKCFGSSEYISIMHKRTSTVDARAVIINEVIL